MRHVLGGIFLLLVSTFASATEVVRCDSCNPATKRSVAIAVANVPNVGNHEVVYFFDYTNQTLSRWYVENSADMGQVWANSTTVPVAEQDAFAEYISAFEQHKLGGHRVTLPGVPGEPDINYIQDCGACADTWVLDNIHSFSNQMSFFDAFRAAIGNLGASIGASGAQVTATTNNEIVYEVEYAGDNSPNQAYCVANLTGAGIEIDRRKCYDSDLNKIPYTAADVQGEVYRFSNNANLNAFRSRLLFLGVNTTGMAASVSVGRLRVGCNEEGCTDMQ